MKLSIFALLPSLLLVSSFAQENIPSIPSQDAFFRAISELCGKAYTGTVTVDNDPGDTFSNKKLIMHVRRCDDAQLQIPFHVGDDASRTWLITRTGSGLSLKHDHRHRDGTEDKLTQYGGHTVDAGWAQVQSFPADQYSKELFVANAIPQSVGNTWQMYIYSERFTYRLIRQGREFRVDFDLTNPVDPPPAPWGYDDARPKAAEEKPAETGDVRAHINRAWRSDGLDFCNEAIAGRYPVVRGNPAGDIRLGDFGAFFGHDGVMDRFFLTNLQNHVDTSREPWRWRFGSGMAGASRAALAQFERARLIRDTFFRGGEIPSVRFDLRPVSMDTSIHRFVLTLGGQTVEYSHGPQISKAMEWPGDGPTDVRLEMMPPTGGGPLIEVGDWAWFKLLDSSSMTPAARPEHFNIVFSVGGRTASWELRAASAFNPFRIDALEQFSCPGKL